jgi:hypothetical protein
MRTQELVVPDATTLQPEFSTKNMGIAKIAAKSAE